MNRNKLIGHYNVIDCMSINDLSIGIHELNDSVQFYFPSGDMCIDKSQLAELGYLFLELSRGHEDPDSVVELMAGYFGEDFGDYYQLIQPR